MSKVILFHWIDYLVFALFMVASTGIGFVVGWRDKRSATNKEYLVGGKNMHWVPTSLSMQAAFLSAVSVLATPVEIYYFGTMFSYLVIGCSIAFPVAAHVFLSFFYKLNLISAYEYLEMRFNKGVRIVGALTFFLMVILYNSVILYTPAIALAQVTGLSINISILLCGSICSLYTFVGGMKGTIWIDTMQVMIIFIGFIFLIIFGSIRVGGMSEVWQISKNGGRIIFDDFRVDPTIRTTFWTQMIGTLFSSVCLWSSSQTMIQKFLSVRTLRDAYKTAYVNSITNFLFIVLATIVGLIAFAHFEGCDPQMAGKITKFDQIIPLLVMEIMGHLHGLPGIFIATIFSASLSSLSGSLTAMSAVTMYDFILPIYDKVKDKPMEDRSKMILTKALVLLYGVIAIGSGYLAQYMGDSILQISVGIFGFVGGPLTSLVVMGVCFPFINSWGALSGLIVSLVISSWMAVGSVVVKSPLSILNVSIDKCSSDNISIVMSHVTLSIRNNSLIPPTATSWFYRISFFHYALIALIVAIVVAIPVSIATGRAKNVDAKLTYNYDQCCYCCSSADKCLESNDDDDDDDDDDKHSSNIPAEQLILKENK